MLVASRREGVFGALAILFLFTGCQSTANWLGAAPSEDRILTTVSLDVAKKAVEAALTEDGFEKVQEEDPSPDDTGAVAQTVGKRSATMNTPFGVTATVVYYEQQGDQLELEVRIAPPKIGFMDPERGKTMKRIREKLGMPAMAPIAAMEKDDEFPAFTGQRHALVVGISTYQDSNFELLDRARTDAEAFSEYLRSESGGNIASDRIHLLVDGKATRRNVLSSLFDLQQDAREGDLIIIYFAGHGRAPGGEESSRYLVPYDGEFINCKSTCIDKRDLERGLDEAEARRQILLLDCCFAGGNFAARGGIEDDALKSLGRSDPKKKIKRYVITSTKSSQRALDAHRVDAKNSPFATALLDALRGDAPEADENEDSFLTARELYDFVRNKVPRLAREAGMDMTPQIYPSEGGEELELFQLNR